MSAFGWLPGYLACLREAQVVVRQEASSCLAPAEVLAVNVEGWKGAAGAAASFGCRWAGLWGDMVGESLLVHACLEYAGDYLVLFTEVPLSHPLLPSHTPHFPGADRLERHLRDMFGIEFSDHPDNRRWTRHQAWPEDCYPLRDDFPVGGLSPKRAPADSGYPFARVRGSGVYEIPVGPVHAGIIEPGHFRFQAVGEEVLCLEQRLGYVHKGIEKIAVGRDPQGLARLAARVSGDSTVAHGWAACMAMERAAGAGVPPRALALRALMCERERVANHLGDIGAICNDVGFAFVHLHCARLRELWLRRSLELFGHRLMMDAVLPGGVARDLNDAALETLRRDLQALRDALTPLADIIDDQPSLEDRLVGTGRLSTADARALGCTGYVGKASGVGFDVRRDGAYPPYDGLSVEVSVKQEGDVAARVQVRLAELHGSLDIMAQLLETLPPGEIATEPPVLAEGATGLGIVDGWRGEIITYVRCGPGGRVARFFPRDPSWFLWPALERLINGNIVPDFPVCNKSVNGSYSGHDL